MTLKQKVTESVADPDLIPVLSKAKTTPQNSQDLPDFITLNKGE